MVRAIVFDFDGVIANSEPLHFRAFRDVLALEGVTLTEAEYYERYLGFNDERAFEAIAADRGRPAWDGHAIADLTRRKAVITAELERGQSILFPGAREAIQRLAAMCPLAIASGALGSEISRTLTREGLAGHFAAIVSADDAVASKPAPDAYLRAVDLLRAGLPTQGDRLTAADCVAVEDSPWGLDSARAAGLRTVGVTHTYPAEALTADLVLGRVDLLTWDLLRTLEGPPERP
jgi:HAD superfamily hydrolase (TIGR01509 family)